MTRQVRIIGGKVTDVAYTHEFEGTYNVTTLLAAVIDNPRVQRAECPFIASVVHAVRAADTSPEAQREMTRVRADRPVLVLMTAGDTGILADGNNRLLWKINQGDQAFYAYIVPYEMAQEHRLQIQMSDDDGRTWYSLDDGEMLRAEWGQHHRASATPL